MKHQSHNSPSVSLESSIRESHMSVARYTFNPLIIFFAIMGCPATALALMTGCGQVVRHENNGHHLRSCKHDNWCEVGRSRIVSGGEGLAIFQQNRLAIVVGCLLKFTIV